MRITPVLFHSLERTAPFKRERTSVIDTPLRHTSFKFFMLLATLRGFSLYRQPDNQQHLIINAVRVKWKESFSLLLYYRSPARLLSFSFFVE